MSKALAIYNAIVMSIVLIFSLMIAQAIDDGSYADGNRDGYIDGLTDSQAYQTGYREGQDDAYADEHLTAQ